MTLPVKIYNGILETFIWLKIWKILSFFWFEKCIFLWISPLLHINKECASHFRREPANKNIRLIKDTKTLLSNSYLTRQSFQGYRCKSDIVIFACTVKLEVTLTVPLKKKVSSQNKKWEGFLDKQEKIRRERGVVQMIKR